MYFQQILYLLEVNKCYGCGCGCGYGYGVNTARALNAQVDVRAATPWSLGNQGYGLTGTRHLPLSHLYLQVGRGGCFPLLDVAEVRGQSELGAVVVLVKHVDGEGHVDHKPLAGLVTHDEGQLELLLRLVVEAVGSARPHTARWRCDGHLTCQLIHVEEPGSSTQGEQCS